MLKYILCSLIANGTLTVIRADGSRFSAGSGEPHVAFRIHDRRAEWELALHPDLKLGELYMDGRLTMEEGDIYDLLLLAMSNTAYRRVSGLLSAIRTLRRLFRRLSQYNPARRAKDHVAHHYDLSGKLYETFLDRDRQYSCAYFSAPGETLEEAQIGKKRHLAAKLYLNKPGLNVLDIGSGWGGLALDLARDGNANVLGVTLSEEQLAVARERSERAQLSARCKFELIDYRSLKGTFDRIVSVGMFEHVGVPHYAAFFEKIHDLLANEGVAVIHTIGRTDGGGATNSWIAKYIFPGGYTPALSEMLPAIERAGLMVTDVEILRLHYAETLKEWRRRFKAQWTEAAALYDERFCRMWEFYLAGSEATFRVDGLVVFQVQVTKSLDALPITRDYMVDDERTMRFAGTGEMPKPRRVA
jgi:cyclopropane-fatty-acyl-phospholipid synthase